MRIVKEIEMTGIYSDFILQLDSEGEWSGNHAMSSFVTLWEFDETSSDLEVATSAAEELMEIAVAEGITEEEEGEDLSVEGMLSGMIVRKIKQKRKKKVVKKVKPLFIEVVMGEVVDNEVTGVARVEVDGEEFSADLNLYLEDNEEADEDDIKAAAWDELEYSGCSLTEGMKVKWSIR